jgi:hypothetical protein
LAAYAKGNSRQGTRQTHDTHHGTFWLSVSAAEVARGNDLSGKRFVVTGGAPVLAAYPSQE